jgi:transposase-like protein
MANKVTKARAREVLAGYFGDISATARHFNVSRQTVYNWIERWNLADALDDARDNVFEMAEQNAYQRVIAGDWDASKFVLLNMPPGKRRARWSSKTDTSVTVEGIALSPDVIALMQKLGISTSDAAREFETLIREAAGVENARS